jgi:hypothetical protein
VAGMTGQHGRSAAASPSFGTSFLQPAAGGGMAVTGGWPGSQSVAASMPVPSGPLPTGGGPRADQPCDMYDGSTCHYQLLTGRQCTRTHTPGQAAPAWEQRARQVHMNQQRVEEPGGSRRCRRRCRSSSSSSASRPSLLFCQGRLHQRVA